eukprot:4716290-Amphidinium_carterae.2
MQPPRGPPLLSHSAMLERTPNRNSDTTGFRFGQVTPVFAKLPPGIPSLQLQLPVCAQKACNSLGRPNP